MDDFHYIIRKLTKGNIDLKIDIKPLLRTVITYTKVCRLCLKDNCLRSASDTFEGDLKNFDIVWTLLGIIIPNEFNIMICESCLDVLSLFHKYRQKCKTNNRAMLKLEGYLDEIREKKTDTVLHCEDSVGNPLDDLQPVQDSENLEIEIKPEPIEMEIEAVIESSVTVPAQIVKEELHVTHENTGQYLKKYMLPGMYKTHIQCPVCQLYKLRSNFKRHLKVHKPGYEYKQKIAAELLSVDLNVETSSEKSESIMLQRNSTEESEDIGLFVIDGQSFKEYKLCSKCGGYVHSSHLKQHIESHRPACKIKGVERMTSNTDPEAATHDEEPSDINVVDREYFREYVSCPICQHYMHYHFINRHTATHIPGYKGRPVVVKHIIIDQAVINSAANKISKSTRPEVNELQNDVATVINGGLNDKYKYYCSACLYRSSVLSNMIRHIECVHKIKVQRESRKSKNHVKSKHLNSTNEYQCSGCPYRSKIRTNIKKHVKTRHAPNAKYPSIFSECAVSLQINMNIQHQKKKDSSELRAIEPATTDQKVSIIIGALNDIKKYYCSACLYCTSQLSNMKRHINNAHKIEIQEKSKNSTTASTKNDTQSTVAAEQQNNAECSLNSEKYVTATTTKPEILIDKHPKEHMEERHDTETMEDKSFLSDNNDNVHAVNEVSNENREEEVFTFTEVVINEGMQKVTTHKETLIELSSKRKRKSRTPANDIKSTVSFEQEYKFYCDLCEYRTEQRGNIRRHVKTHALKGKKSSGNVHLRCFLCGFLTEGPVHAQEHMQIKHQIKIEKSEIRAIELAKAVEEVSIIKGGLNDKNKYYCSACLYRSSVLSNMIRHIECVHKIKLQRESRKSKNHVKSKHLNSTNEYQCSGCPYRSKIRANIKKHIKTRHAPNTKNPSIFSECAVSLQINMNIQHQKKNDSSELRAIEPATADQNSKVSMIIGGLKDVYKYYCSACPYRSPQHSNMERHIKNIHKIEIQEKSKNSTTVSTKNDTQSTVAAELQINAECSLNSERYLTATATKLSEPEIVIDKHSKEHMEEKDDTESMDDKSFLNDTVNAINEVSNENREAELFPFTEVVINEGIIEEKFTSDTETLIEVSSNSDKDIHVKQSSKLTNDTDRKYRCGLCDYRYKVSTKLGIHIIKEHLKPADEKPPVTDDLPATLIECSSNDKYQFYCSACPYRCNNLCNIKRHINDQHNKATNKYKLIEESSSKKNYDCSLCVYRSNYFCTLERHIKVKHNIEVFKFAESKASTSELRVEQMNDIFQKSQKLKCTECDLMIPNYIFKSHLQYHCEQKGKKKKLKRIKIKGDRYKYSCPVCQQKFKFPMQMQYHMKVHFPTSDQNADKNRTVSYPCSFEQCVCYFPSEEYRRLHEADHEIIIPPSGKRKPPKTLCDICGESYLGSYQLQKHLQRHAGLNLYSCHFCKKSFREKGSLVGHMRTHTGERPFKCRYCSADYNDIFGRQMHERQKHTKEKPFKCKFCDKDFVCNVKLQNHITIHTGEKKYKCETCGMKFNNNWNQRAHQNVHLREQGKPLFFIRKKPRVQKK